MNKSIILNSDILERDIRGIGMLLHHASRSLLEDGYIDEVDYLSLEIIADKLLEDIAPKVKELIDASYELLREKSK
jgi:hypothetical protein